VQYLTTVSLAYASIHDSFSAGVATSLLYLLFLVAGMATVGENTTSFKCGCQFITNHWK
jgi:hypothetical protein